MANLTQKTKFVNIVVRKNDILISDRDNLIKKWCEENCVNYAYIYHKNDRNLDNIIEREHIHIVCTLHNSQRLSTTLNSFCESVSLTTLGVMIDKVVSYEGSIQYLIHKNDEFKTQHKIDEIISNMSIDDLKAIIDYEITSITPQRLRYLVKNSATNYELIEALGINQYIRLRRLIMDIKDDIRMFGC